MDEEEVAGAFPFSLHWGVSTPTGVLCTSFGFNCLTIPLTKKPEDFKFAAPGASSKLHDPALTELAERLNHSMQLAADSKGGVVGLRVLILNEGLVLTWDTGNPELQGKSAEEFNEIIRKGIPVAHMTAKERKETFDI